MQPKNNIPVLSRSGLQLAKTSDNSLSLINRLIDEGNPEYWYKKAINAKEEENWEGAFYFISKAIRLNTIESKYWTTQSYFAAKIEKPEIAAISLPQALYYRENWGILYSNLNLGEWSDLKSYFQKQNDSEYIIAFAQAFLEFVLKAPEKSLQILNSISQDFICNDVNFYNLRALINFDLGNFESVKEDCSTIISIDPKNAIAYYNRGIAKYNLEESPQVLDDLTKAIELNSCYYQALNFRGRTNYKLGFYDLANIDFSRAIEINPFDPWAFFWRAKTKKALKDFQGVIQDAKMILNFDCPNEISFFISGGIKYSISDYQGALIDLSKAIESGEKDTKAYLYRGRAKLKLKDFKGAIEDFDQVLNQNPKQNKALSLKDIAIKELEKLQNINEV